MKKMCVFEGIVLSSCLLIFSCCTKSTINKSMQDAAIEMTKAQMTTAKIDSAVVMITSVSTGEMLVKTKLVKNVSNGQFVESPKDHIDMPFVPGNIVIPFNVMGAMDESGYRLSDEIDTGDGHLVLNERSIYDEAVWKKGGYGFIDIAKCVTLPSNIGLVLMLEEVYKGKREAYEKRMKAMSFGAPDEVSPFDLVSSYAAAMNAFTLGVSFKMNPTQLATAWNCFANGGKCMKLTTKVGDSLTINPAAIKPETVQAMKDLLVSYASSEYSKASNVAFYKSIYGVKNTYSQSVTGSFCGFYPADKPQYSCVVVFYYAADPGVNFNDIRYTMDLAGRSLFFSLANMQAQ